MSIVNCPRCNRMFRRLGDRKVCDDCRDREEEALAQVSDWLRDHPGASVAEASAATGIEEKVILRLLREGRVTLLELVRGEDRPRCRRCAAPVFGSSFCATCTRTLGEALQGHPATGSGRAPSSSPETAPPGQPPPRHTSFRVGRDLEDRES